MDAVGIHVMRPCKTVTVANHDQSISRIETIRPPVTKKGHGVMRFSPAVANMPLPSFGWLSDEVRCCARACRDGGRFGRASTTLRVRGHREDAP